MSRSEQEILNAIFDATNNKIQTSGVAVAFDGNAANNRVSAIQADGANLRLSAVQTDASNLRVSSLMVDSGGASFTILNKYQRVSAAGATIVWTPGAGKSIRLTDVIFSPISASVIYFAGAGGAAINGPIFLAAAASWDYQFRAPLPLSANEALGISADTANSVGVTFLGFEV